VLFCFVYKVTPFKLHTQTDFLVFECAEAHGERGRERGRKEKGVPCEREHN
jgi:hypothetical protein